MIPPVRSPPSPVTLWRAWRRPQAPPPANGLFCGSGTEALFLIFSFLRDRQGARRVLLSPFNCGSVLSAVTAARLEPVFIDFATASSLALDLGQLEREVSPEPGHDLVLYAHLFGFSPGYAEIAAFCRARKIFLLEDAAHLPWGWPRTDACLGNAAIFSFGPSKPLNPGTGGAAWLHNELWPDFRAYAEALPHTATGNGAALLALALTHLKTTPLVLGAAAACGAIGRDALGPPAATEQRLHGDGWRQGTPFQARLAEEMLAEFSPVREHRRRVLASYREALHGLPDLQMLCDERDLYEENAPVRVPVTVAPEQRLKLVQILRHHGLWASTWIPQLLSANRAPGKCLPFATALLARLVALPTGFTGRELPTGKLGRALKSWRGQV